MRILRTANSRSLVLAAIGATSVLFAGCGGSTTAPGATAGVIPNATHATTVGVASSRSASANIEAAAYTFTTLDDQADPTFNQLLGINNHNVISGYFGSGMSGHPNKGYILRPPYGQANYVNENFPGSAQTQVTAINNKGYTAGFWVGGKGVNRGFVDWNGVFTSYRDPNTGTGTVNQLLGLNDNGIAVGFYTGSKGVNHGYKLNQATGVFTPVTPPGASNVTASAINANGDITGFYTSGMQTIGFLYKNGQFTTFDFPGSTVTNPFGINIHDTIVGSYLDGSGVMHGFTLKTPIKGATWQSIDDPNGVGSTVVNGLNDNGELVGFYTDAAGNTDGMLATP